MSEAPRRRCRSCRVVGLVGLVTRDAREDFGTRLGYRLPEGRQAYARYYQNAIDVPRPETEALERLGYGEGAAASHPYAHCCA